MSKDTGAPIPSSIAKSMVVDVPSAMSMARGLTAQIGFITELSAQLDVCRKTGDVTSLARAFVVLRRLKDKWEDANGQFNELFELYKKEYVPEAIEGSGQTHIALVEGYRVGVGHNVRASIREGMREKAYKWLRSHKLGELITETVNASTLSATAKLMRQENRDLPDSVFNVYDETVTSVTQTKGKGL